MGLVGCIIGLEEIYNTSKRSEENRSKLSALDQEFVDLFSKNKRLFNENFSKTTPSLFGEGQK